MVVFHNDIINAIAQARNIRHLLASDILERWQQGEEATVEQSQSLIQLGDWIDFLTDSEQLVVDGCIDSTDVWNIIQQIGEQAIGLDCVGTNYNYGNPPPTANTNILNYVETVRGLNTNNTDPQNPIVRISVDGSTITGDGTPASPLIATAPLGGVQSVTGNLVNNADPENPVVNSPLTADELAAIQGANAPNGTNVFATLTDIAGGTQTLAQTLINGNLSGAKDIQFDAAQGLLFDNGARVREGTTNAGLGGNKGVSQVCSLDYELKWEAGRQYVMQQDGTGIRQSLYNFTTTPTPTDDFNLGYAAGSLWTLDDGTVYECTFAGTLGGDAVWINRGGAGILEITVGALQTLESNGELSLTTIYIITDIIPYKLMCKAEAVNQLSKTATIVDAVYSGQVYYDLEFDTISNGTIYDVNNNTWNGTFPTDTILLGTSGSNIFEQYTQVNELGDACQSNTFKQYASENILGATCEGNIFNAKASENILGDICYYNTFGQRAKTNTLGSSCNHNFFHQNSCSNVLSIDCRNNVFGQGSVSNTLGEACEQNTFEQDASRNTLGVGCTNNIFNSASTDNILGDNCNFNTFEQRAHIITLGRDSINNTFGQYATSFTFGDGLQNVTIDAGMTGADYSDPTTYAFLYNKDYAATIFQSGSINYHRYFDIANDRIVVTDLVTPTNITYIGGGAGSGTVTSVGLSMPSAFSVASSPVTTSGTIAVTGAGVTSQYVRGDGSLANFPSIGGGGASLNYYLNGSVAQGTFGGVAMKEINKTPIIGAGTDFTIATDGYIQSFITDANDPNQLSIPAGNWNFETYFSALSNGGSPSFYIELHKWDGTTLTLIATSSATPEAITGGTAIDLYLTALAVPQTTLALTDRLVVRIYVTHSGRTIKLHTEDSHLSQIITTFSTGISALNGLTANVQTLEVGSTGGTDFSIVSLSSIHKFVLPTASASARGALSSADWSAFNALKVENLSLQDGGSSIAATTYTLELYAAYAYTINQLKIISASGTCTVAVKINGVDVTGISAVAVSSTIATGTASAANTVAEGDKITLVTTSNSALTNLQASLKTTRI